MSDPPLRLVAGVAAHKGHVREKQEDAHLVLDELGVVAVADGMGGHQAGDVASQLAIEALREHFGAVATGTQPRGFSGLLRRFGLGGRPSDALVLAIRTANRRILASARRVESQRGMGTTLVVAWLCGARLHFAHVGDSRLYLLRAGVLRQLTRDHSLVNEYLRTGQLTPETLPAFPHKNVIVRAVGLSGGVEVDVGETDLMPEDRLLLCSDGLTDLVDDARIRDSLAAGDEPESCARTLVTLALEAGGIDNVTALVIRVSCAESPVEPGEVKDDPSLLAAGVDPGASPDGSRR